MSQRVSDRTVGQLVGPDGAPLQRPTTLLSADAASILRAYFLWAMREQLEPELVCTSCFDYTRDSKALYQIDERQITIVCQCQIRFFEGASLPGDPIVASRTVPQTDDAGVGHVLISSSAARLLRLYKKVLLDLGLQEMLRCNACYRLDQADGCHAQVLTSSIQIRCRCSDRRYQWMTI